jgi:3-oxoacyl-[acyl-carrier-protein] synthase-1
MFGRKKRSALTIVQPEKKIEPVAITGIGFVCPIGCNAWETALAVRKGRARFSEHESVMVADDSHGTVLRGATVSRIPGEQISPWLDGRDRAISLVVPALRECISTSGLSPQMLRKAFIQIDNLLSGDTQDFQDQLQREFPEIPLSAEAEDTAAELTRCSFFERIMQASESLRCGQEHVALVGCVDSNAAVSRLEELLHGGRLQEASNPEGLIASEAAGAVLLETGTHARARKAPIIAFISSFGRGTEPNPWTGPRPSVAKGLTDAFHEAISGLEDRGKNVGMVISDMNGERPRALEWGLTQGRVFPEPDMDPRIELPLFTIGDCGGAAGAAMLVAAIGQFLFHHKASKRIALAVSDDAGDRRVICLERGYRPDRRLFMDGIRKQLNMI